LLDHPFLPLSTSLVRAIFKVAYWYKLRRIKAGVPQDKACRWGDALVFKKV
jgi:long-subunit acyl-CoA synthetase (AMP-forming)